MTYLNIASSCKITLGFSRALMIDLERNLFIHLPLDVAKILEPGKNIKYSSVKEQLFHNSDSQELIEFLLLNKFCRLDKIITSEISTNEKFSSPFPIEDLIIDVDDQFEYLNEFISQSHDFPIETIQIRFFSKIHLNKLSNVIERLGVVNVKYLEFVIPFGDKLEANNYLNILTKYQQISRLVVFNWQGVPAVKYNDRLLLVANNILDESACGKITVKHMLPNLRSYLTSKTCNTCLFRKISIDKKGNIKNCPSMINSHGNVKSANLKGVLENDNFKRYWHITKDQIHVCKDCEFRNICTDCRAYTENPNVQNGKLDLYKPLKCGYDPYTMRWSEWATDESKRNLWNSRKLQIQK